jgi:ElaB/YqjD/DUF883 family membrane-anchored ribosome-binding protein
MNQDITENLSDELKTIAAEAEELIKTKSNDLAERTKEIRDRLAAALDTAQQTLDTLETQAADKAKKADHLIRSSPYQAVGIALAVGLALGLFLKRK